MRFPKDFLWGAAVSAYQVEGGVDNADWSRFHPAGEACRHYHLYKKDFDLLESLNLNAFRFSIEWSRIEPQPGKWNKKEMEHYRGYLKELKKRGIKTMVTLHHFTTPLWISERGGWNNPKIRFWFPRFADKMFEQYRDLVDLWVTINEPVSVYAALSYYQGRWPPQKKGVIPFLKTVGNQIKSHKKIYDSFHKKDGGVKVGVAKHNSFFQPQREVLLDKLSAGLLRYLNNHLFLERISKNLDFIGLNYYRRSKIRFPFFREQGEGPVSDMGWEIHPRGIYHTLKELKKYSLPLYVTENGLADEKDDLRRDFIKNHLYWVWRAIKEGAEVRGYFHWSLLDNLEWDNGFEPRFGLVQVDYETMKRRTRDSARYLSEVAEKNKLIP